MVPPAPSPSPRLLKAAKAERQQLAAHRRELLAARDSLRAELQRIEASLNAVDERRMLLDRLVGPTADSGAEEGAERLARRPLHHQVGDESSTGVVLRGPAIRREAVRVLLANPDRPEALHYRAWFDLLTRAGFRVAGKDPLATFLTQLSRSPAVRKSTQSGVYELDRGAAARLRRRVEQLHDELRALTTAPTAGGDGGLVRNRRSELNAQLSRTEKALEEVEALFAQAREQAPPLAAVG